MLSNALIMLAIIFAVNVVYVSLMTIRMILTLKGRKYIAAFVSVFEITVYIVGLGLVLDNLNEIQNLIAYALGFGTGLIIGSIIEEKLALGYITVNVVSTNPDLKFTKRIREKGYGVTSWSSYGMDGDRLSISILTPRKYELRLYELIQEIDPKAFIISYEPKRIHGGFWVKQVRKGKLMNPKKKAAAESAKKQIEREELMKEDPSSVNQEKK
ncbi:DUF2179 domain-containing protein [Oceanobacillus profundus]|uniref:UPF0316 protein D1B32_18475 n=2 Tax=Bacillaceae TaxID=186817 RepID=A0A417YBK0_9BACI|nr:DUF2179 domain-containing protein [Oceanobacillus profundus]MCM3397826.1 DUF2179 domain-containing protein [Oceanobacillus profundus]PAE28048.1 DUF2179 domain-containing protein [Paenibacillus sp. 7884-2]RHW30060.1 DUF2179 domain-containing protein [Oceanobacillus profundus]